MKKIVMAALAGAVITLCVGYAWGAPAAIHNHFTQPSQYAISTTKVLSDYIDAKALVQTYEYQYKEHIDSLEGIIEDYSDRPSKLKGKEKAWEAQKERIINHLNYNQDKLERINNRQEMLADGNVPKV